MRVVVEEGEGAARGGGELIGQTLFEEVSTSAFDKQDLLDQLDEATMALSEQELKQARDLVETGSGPKKKGSVRDKIVLLVLLLAAAATAYVSFFAEDPDAEEPLQTNARRQATLPSPSEAEQEAEIQPAEDIPQDNSVETEGASPTDETPESPETDASSSIVPAPAPTASTPSAPVQPSPPRVATPPSKPIEPSPEEASAPDMQPVAIRINSVPFGIPVLVDGTPAGRTPIQILPLDPGSHVLLFQDGETSIRYEIQVSPDGKSSWRYIQTERKVR